MLVVMGLAGAALALAGAASAAEPASVGVADPDTGLWYLNDGGGGTARFFFGDPGDVAFMGDWDCDGVATPGLYRQSDGFVYLRNSNSQGVADVEYFFGDPSDVPLAGDFDGDGCDTVSLYRPSEGKVFVINRLGDGQGGLGPADFDFVFGNPGDDPFVGDFDGNGVDEIGLRRESTGFAYLRFSLTTGTADLDFFYGDPGDKVLAGDWDGDGDDTIGLYRPGDTTFYLSNRNGPGAANLVVPYGEAHMQPLAGAFGDLITYQGVGIARVLSGLSSPVFVDAPPGDPRLFIVERAGRIKVWDGTTLETLLDISGIVRSGGEQGLLGMAFHPGFAANGRYFVNYTDLAGDTRIAEYPGGNVLLAVDQPASNHNGGMIAFGPDGRLWIGMGDGGGGGDPGNHGQNPATLLGSMLRLDVDAAQPVPEVHWWGLRNPWRFSFDPANGDVYIGDVGQNAWEEIDVARHDVAGVNWGWNALEGNACFSPSTGCDRSGKTPPTIAYGHGEGCSVTGGYVYRGSALPGLTGTYFYGDFCTGFIRSYRRADGLRRDWTATLGTVSFLASFGTDGSGELYVVSLGGDIYKLVPGINE